MRSHPATTPPVTAILPRGDFTASRAPSNERMFPRYEWHAQPTFVLQVDRWHGKIRRLPTEMIGLYVVDIRVWPTQSTHSDQMFELLLERSLISR